VKVTYRSVPGGKRGVAVLAKAAGYLTRDGASIENGKPELFTQKGRDTEDALVPMKGEQNVFRITISPEDGQKMDLKNHAQAVMKQAEKAVGHKIEWVAAVHTNTETPHVHVLVRGAHDGKPFRFERDMVQHGFREISREKATLELGERSREEIRRTKAMELKAERLTMLDRKMGERQRGRTIQAESDREMRCLSNLEGMRVARYRGGREFTMADNWQNTLKEIGYSKDIHKQMHRHLRGTDQERKPQFIHSGTRKVSGTVVTKDYDDLRDNKPYVIIKTKDGDYWYSKSKAHESVQKGDPITLGRDSGPHEQQQGPSRPAPKKLPNRDSSQEIER